MLMLSQTFSSSDAQYYFICTSSVFFLILNPLCTQTPASVLFLSTLKALLSLCRCVPLYLCVLKNYIPSLDPWLECLRYYIFVVYTQATRGLEEKKNGCCISSFPCVSHASILLYKNDILTCNREVVDLEGLFS